MHAHNCQDFASELIDLLRLTGQASVALEPAAATPTDTAGAGASAAAGAGASASAAGSCPGTEFEFDVRDLVGDLREIDVDEVPAPQVPAPQQGSVTEAAGLAAEARAAEAAGAAGAAAAAGAAEAAVRAVVQAVEEAVEAKEVVVLATGPVAATGATVPDSTPEAAEEAAGSEEDGWEVISGKPIT